MDDVWVLVLVSGVDGRFTAAVDWGRVHPDSGALDEYRSDPASCVI